MTFDQLKELLPFLIWPVSGLIALLIFRGPISILISRAIRARHGETSVEFSDPASIAGEQKKSSANQITKDQPRQDEGPPPPPTEAIAPIENHTKNLVENSSSSIEVKLAWVIRGYAQERLNRIHEQNYRLILGSQLSLLLAANTATNTHLTNAKQIYEAARLAFQEIYTNFAFDDWINWPKNAGLIAISNDNPSDPVVSITPAGRDFMHYLVSSGLTNSKQG